MPPRLARSSFTDGYFCELRVQVIVVIVLVSKLSYLLVDPSHQLLSHEQRLFKLFRNWKHIEKQFKHTFWPGNAVILPCPVILVILTWYCCCICWICCSWPWSPSICLGTALPWPPGPGRGGAPSPWPLAQRHLNPNAWAWMYGEGSLDSNWGQGQV